MKNKIKIVCKEINFAGCVVVDAVRHSGVLALLWKNIGAHEVTEVNKHSVEFEVQNEQVGRWTYTGFTGV